MRTNSVRWPLALIGVAAILAWYIGPSTGILARLAGQPDVQGAFQAEGGSTDALLVLLAFAVLTPLALAGVVVLVCFLVKALGDVFSRIHMPEWMSTAVVVVALSWGSYALRDAWLPAARYVLGLSARAYLVYTSSLPVPPQ